MGRGSKQVKSCDLLRKRDGAGRAIKERGIKETEISARFIDVLLYRHNRRESHKPDECAQV